MSLAENFKQSTYLGYVAILRILLGFHFLVLVLRSCLEGF
jgi:hypothetical protein